MGLLRRLPESGRRRSQERPHDTRPGEGGGGEGRHAYDHRDEPPTGSVPPDENWLRDDLEEVHALLFRFLGYGFQLAMSNVDWLVTQKFVILVPDPIGFAPWSVLLGPGEPCDSCAGVNVDSSPRCGGFLLSHLLSQVRRRQKQLEVESGKGDFVSTKRYWRLPKSCGSQSSEWEERKKSRESGVARFVNPHISQNNHSFHFVQPLAAVTSSEEGNYRMSCDSHALWTS